MGKPQKIACPKNRAKRSPMELPRKLTFGHHPIRIQEAALDGPLGSWEANDGGVGGVIRIERQQPWVGKWLVLIHELLHVIDDHLVAIGQQSRRSPHSFIRGAPINLLSLLIEAGLIRGISRRQFMSFIRSQQQ